MLLGAAASAGTLILTYLAKDAVGLYASAVPAALLQHNFSVGKAYMADASNYHGAPSRDLAALVGRLGMVAGLSFMIGPILGSYVFDTFDVAVAASVTCCAISAICIFIAESYGVGGKGGDGRKKRLGKSSIVSLDVIKYPGVIPLATIRILMSLAFNVFATAWSPSLKARFDFTPSMHGRLMSYVGLVYALSQGFVSKAVIGRYGDRPRLVLSLASAFLGLGRVIAYTTSSLPVVYLTFAFIVTSLGVANTVLSSDATRIAGEDDIGGMLGFLDAVQCVSGMVGVSRFLFFF